MLYSYLEGIILQWLTLLPIGLVVVSPLRQRLFLQNGSVLLLRQTQLITNIRKRRILFGHIMRRNRIMWQLWRSAEVATEEDSERRLLTSFRHGTEWWQQISWYMLKEFAVLKKQDYPVAETLDDLMTWWSWWFVCFSVLKSLEATRIWFDRRMVETIWKYMDRCKIRFAVYTNCMRVLFCVKASVG